MATRDQIRRELEGAISKIVSRMSVQMLQDLREGTRKDTQYHSSRWVGRAGSSPPSVSTPDSRSGRAALLSFGQHNASLASLSVYRIEQGNVTIANDGSYIAQLDAQDGFVSKAISRAIRVSLAGTGLR